MSTGFDVSPQKEGQMLNFFRRQLFFAPPEVTNVNLEGKTAIVTGSNVGIGFACCQHLLRLGISRLILGVRDEAKGQAAAADLAKIPGTQHATIEIWIMDLQSYESIEAFANRAKSLNRLDIVILNAAVMPIKHVLNTQTGHDESVQANYISTALLLILLLGVIKDRSYNVPTRVTIVSSDAAAWTNFKEKHNDPLLASFDKSDNWDAIDRHFVTKLLMQLFVAELTPHVPSSLAVINMVTPGVVYDTEVTREARTIFIEKVAHIIRKRIGFTSLVGARLVIDAAVNHGSETHGHYMSENRIKPMAPIVYTEEGARVRAKLWKETMAELSFSYPENIIKAIGSDL